MPSSADGERFRSAAPLVDVEIESLSVLSPRMPVLGRTTRPVLNWFLHAISNHDTGDPVEADFVESWDSLEVVFDWMLVHVPWKDRVFQFIAQLRQAGYDRKLRAGQSLEVFIVSRSRRHGLRPDQHPVVFCFHDDVMDVLEGNEPKIRNTEISLSGPVQAVLARLLSRDID